MSENADPAAPSPDPVVTNQTPASLLIVDDVPSSPLLRSAGLIGLVACLIGLAALLAGCGGLKTMSWSVVIVPLGGIGLLLTVLACIVQRKQIGEDTHIMAGLFTNLIAIIGGLLEMGIWLGWPLIPK